MLLTGEGAVTLARGTWDGLALTEVKDIFESNAARHRSVAPLAFGRDATLDITISAQGHAGRSIVRRIQPTDAGKIVRLRDDGSIPVTIHSCARAGYKPAIFMLGHRNGHSTSR